MRIYEFSSLLLKLQNALKWLILIRITRLFSSSSTFRKFQVIRNWTKQKLAYILYKMRSLKCRNVFAFEFTFWMSYALLPLCSRFFLYRRRLCRTFPLSVSGAWFNFFFIKLEVIQVQKLGQTHFEIIMFDIYSHVASEKTKTTTPKKNEKKAKNSSTRQKYDARSFLLF